MFTTPSGLNDSVIPDQIILSSLICNSRFFNFSKCSTISIVFLLLFCKLIIYSGIIKVLSAIISIFIRFFSSFWLIQIFHMGKCLVCLVMNVKIMIFFEYPRIIHSPYYDPTLLYVLQGITCGFH